MSEVKRCGFTDGVFGPKQSGGFVETADYSALEQERDALVTNQTALRARVAELEAQVAAMKGVDAATCFAGLPILVSPILPQNTIMVSKDFVEKWGLQPRTESDKGCNTVTVIPPKHPARKEGTK